MEDNKLQLRLGPPGDAGTPLSLDHNSCGTKRGLLSSDLEGKSGERKWLPNSTTKSEVTTTNTILPDSSEKRMAIGTVVGWPPVRSFRRNLATSSSSKGLASKGSMESRHGEAANVENSLFVKIRMDGVPIGRKIDLKAYTNYQTLSSAVDELFRCLLAAQLNHSDKTEEEMMKTKAITGLLDGNGQYTLVYEDNEGDRMLVGDVPWNMFVSTAKRLRVLKGSELSSLQGNHHH